MGSGIILCLASLSLFVGLIFISSVFKSKLFSLSESSSGTGKTAAECASIMLDAYDVHDEDGFDKKEDEDEEDKDNEDEDEYDEEEINEEDIENNAKSNRNYVYENIDDDGKTVHARTYETFADDSAKILEQKENEKVEIHSCVEVIKGKQKYGINSGREFAVLLSSDIYHSDSLAATCIACYQAAKLSEGVDKPFVYKLISFVNFIPKMICQFSWVLSALIVMRILYLPVDISFIVGAVSIVSFFLALLDSIYYYELANITVNNMIKLEIVDKNDVDVCKQLMNIVALTESSRFLHSLRWFANKILCYRV